MFSSVTTALAARAAALRMGLLKKREATHFLAFFEVRARDQKWGDDRPPLTLHVILEVKGLQYPTLVGLV